ncbi:MAG: hypothetical protein WA979_13960, partial [Pacificimonas sp.]
MAATRASENDIRTLAVRAVTQARSGNRVLAAALLDQAVSVAAGCPRTLSRLGHIFIEQESLGPALAAFDAALAAGPESFDALMGKAALLSRCGDEAAAERLTERAARLAPVRGGEGAAPHVDAIACARCLRSSRYRIVRNRRSGMRATYKGGHFALKGFFEGDAPSMATMNLGYGDKALSLPGSPALLINTIACADAARQSLTALAAYVRGRPHMPVVNRPDDVLATTRDANFRRAPTGDVRFARTVRLSVSAPPDAV